MFDLTSSDQEVIPTQDKDPHDEEPRYPAVKLHAHDGTFHSLLGNDIAPDSFLTDSVGTVSFHPLHPLLLSASGSRHFEEGAGTASEYSDSDTESESDDEVQLRIQTKCVPIRRSRMRPAPSTRDSSIKIWNFVKGREEFEETLGT